MYLTCHEVEGVGDELCGTARAELEPNVGKRTL